MNLSISPLNGILKPQKTNLLKNQNRIGFSSACDSVSFGNIDKDKQVKALLDNTEFKFVDSEGEEFEGTVRDYLENSRIRYYDIPENFSTFHCTQSKETAEDIVKNGLDWTKTYRTKCGPGVYFSSRGAGSMVGCGGHNVKAVYTGDMEEYPVFKRDFYDAITDNNELRDKVSQITGETGSRNAINKYCHDLLQDDMGIDFLYAPSGRFGGAYVVFNNDCWDLSYDGYEKWDF